jgi:hypothetical protein
MTIKEKYGTFENYEKHLAEEAKQAILEEIPILQDALAGRNGYMVQTHLSAAEVRVHLLTAEHSLKYLEGILNGEYHSEIYRHRWHRMRYTEA